MLANLWTTWREFRKSGVRKNLAQGIPGDFGAGGLGAGSDGKG
jgi:hypothetical protein